MIRVPVQEGEAERKTARGPASSESSGSRTAEGEAQCGSAAGGAG